VKSKLGRLGVVHRGKIKLVISAAVLVAALLSRRDAAAEFTLANDDGWVLTIDGRLNAFINYTLGDPTPKGVSNWSAGIFENPDPNSGKIAVVRIRTGFVQNVLGFGMSKQVTPNYKLSGRFALWAGASNERKPVLGQQADVEAREAYVRVDAPWGTVQAGRDLGLYGRGGILMDAEIVHANGLGSPCSTQSILGGACGFAGHGVLFPAFNASFLYSTPKLAGLQATVGLFDPSVNSEKNYEITPYPRIEAQIAYNFHDTLKVYGEAMWQRLINTSPVTDTNGDPVLDANMRPTDHVADANGVAAGASLSLGFFQIGGSFYQGTGVTMIIPIFNTPIFSDQNNILRKGQGFAGMASVKFGDTKIAGGAGASQLKLTSSEQEPYSMVVPPKQQIGISIGIYQTIFKKLTVAGEIFRGQYSWYKYQQSPMDPVIAPIQNVTFFNLGMTLAF
jgi:hypothetical protein